MSIYDPDTSDLIRKHLPPSQATSKYHLHQESQGLQSTKQIDNDNYLKNINRNITRMKSIMNRF